MKVDLIAAIGILSTMKATRNTIESEQGERIAKRIARAGLCSRREAERWIGDGRVKVDGKVLKSPAIVVDNKSEIIIDGKPLAQSQPTKLWRYHKPKGLLTTNLDPEGRETVFKKLPSNLPRVVTVGRLDLNTEGLLLLTNDGGLARHLELPSTGWRRRYRVRVHGTVDKEALSRLSNGVKIDGIIFGAIEARLDSQKGRNAWLSLSLREGKNREIRKVMEYMQLQVTRLIRLSYGPFQLGDLAKGAVTSVPRRVLADQLGKNAASYGLSRIEGDAHKSRLK